MFSTNKKGQMSLEMIIGLVILLVVAGVIIMMLLHYLNPKNVPNTQEEMAVRDFKQRCEIYCKDGTLNYCRYYFEGNDWDNDGITNELVSVGDIVKWQACEDRIYCFLVVPCQRYGENPIEGCAKQLCNAYKIKYKNNLTLATEGVLEEIIPTTDPVCSHSLKSIKPQDNWMYSYFNKYYGTEDLCHHYIK